jgi:hypothetical protein
LEFNFVIDKLKLQSSVEAAGYKAKIEALEQELNQVKIQIEAQNELLSKEKENNITLASEVKKYQGLNESLTHDKRVQSDALASLQTRVEILLEEKTLALADSESRLLL